MKDKLFNINGRMARLDYFLTSLLVGFIYMVYMVIIGVSLTDYSGTVTGSGVMLMIPAMILFYFINIVITGKRMHDINWSAWMYLTLLIPLVNIGISLVVLFMKGTEGKNRFGADPLK